MNPVEILTVKSKVPLFKKEDPATSIELIQLEEVGFEIVAQKDLYQVGEKVVYIQPDYCLSDIPLFESYLRPSFGSCKLGGNNRIRAIKFGLHRGDGLPVYSQGILLPYSEVQDYLYYGGKGNYGLQAYDLTQALCITKWEEPEGKSSGGLNTGKSKPFPQGVYKTDETNINNLWNHLEKNLGYPVELVGTEKIDGSSITIGVRDYKGFICSRNLEKPLTVKRVVGRRSKKLLEYLLFWKKIDLNIYEEEENDDDFVKYGKPYLDILLQNKVKDLCFRGELNGKTLKGSGNKNNPASKEENNIKFFGMDYLENGNFVKTSNDLFMTYCLDLRFPMVNEVFSKNFKSKEEIVSTCGDFFKKKCIEGIVIRTMDSKFSSKYMNPEYDSKK